MCIGLLFGRESSVYIGELFEEPIDSAYLLAKSRWIGRNNSARKKEMLKILRRGNGYLTVGTCSGTSKGGFLIGLNEKGLAAASISSQYIHFGRLPYFLRDVLSYSKSSEEFLEQGVRKIEDGYFSIHNGGILLSMDKGGLGSVTEVNGIKYHTKLVEGREGYSNCFNVLDNHGDIRFPRLRIKRMNRFLNELNEANFQSILKILTHHGNVRLCRHEEEGWEQFTRSVCITYLSGDKMGLIYYDGPACREKPRILDFNALKEAANDKESVYLEASNFPYSSE